MLFMLEQNYIARALKISFPTCNYDHLFFEGWNVNIAQFQKIVNKAFLPAVLRSPTTLSNVGSESDPTVKAFRENALPIVSV